MKTSTVMLALCMLTGVCSAALVEEGFGPGYTDDASVAGLAPVRTGFAASAWTAGTIDSKRDFFHRAAGLTHALLDGETAGHLDAWVDNLESPPNGGSISRDMDYDYADPNNVNEVWGAFLFAFNSTDGSLDIFLGDATGQGRPAGFRITVSGGTGTVETRHAGNSADNFSVSGLAPDVAHLAVFRMTEDPGTFYDPHTFWVNPAAADISAGDIDGGQTGVAITLNPNLDTDFASAWGSLGLKTDSQNGSNILFDEFRIGESLGDIGVVPEPATMALLALGGLAVVGHRRKA
ncbi:MAG: PEP-CTERM sorting domain-containing protein [Phycisphaerae bacterium]